jgi:hypothetical protein
VRIFEFLCDSCGRHLEAESEETIPIGAPLSCPCGEQARRVFSLPHVPPDSLSVDPDNIPVQHRVASNDGFGIGEKAAVAREKAYEKSMQVKRAMARDRSLSKGSMKMTHSIPPELYHGKIKQTGDRAYWDDPKNRNRHSSTKL